MTPKEIAAHYDAKVFDSPDAATSAGFELGESAQPRNVWNKASAASATPRRQPALPYSPQAPTTDTTI